jgi:Holliday junction resolvasome RuvABC endonuclease subunit
MIRVLGIDPGFASIGWAIVRLGRGEVSPEIEGMGVFHTQKGDRKQGVLASDDNFRRARELAVFFDEAVNDIHVACSESMSYPRNASNAAKVALCWGVLASLCEAKSLPMVQASPQEVKKVLCGKKDASKEDVQQALNVRFNWVPKKMLEEQKVTKSDLEHPYDALAAVVACARSEIVVAMRKMSA